MRSRSIWWPRVAVVGLRRRCRIWPAWDTATDTDTDMIMVTVTAMSHILVVPASMPPGSLPALSQSRNGCTTRVSFPTRLGEKRGQGVFGEKGGRVGCIRRVYVCVSVVEGEERESSDTQSALQVRANALHFQP